MFSAIFLLPAFFLPIFCEPGDRSSANVIFEKLNKEIRAVNEDQNNVEELLQKLNESYSALKFKDSFGPITLLNHFNGLEVNNKAKP
uniref:Uncharacterized protein n=1 Tax=Ditylenchus dipsaci TaxID=166011 RepID=A0A915CS49_9BILA